jgi:Fe-S-cluster-containing hydrogenase component 2
MAFQITEDCVACWACELVCPQQAIIVSANNQFTIDAQRCTECNGDYPESQCCSICPIEGAIIDATGQAVNPIGSLSGLLHTARKNFTTNQLYPVLDIT